ncbi:hypothetical protein A4X13_0g8748 [Tilletia indica]|uniref:FAR1 domain-containing protein n=1 Tax=Tilletia indica TaxID=43049 RepID=A0A8T8SDB0_9BASI|nr:hypothetical protein A4X13_0g8748 [Tilletia indica]
MADTSASSASTMPPPPVEEAFDTSQIAEKYMQLWATTHGYAMVKLHSAKKGRCLYFICDKGGHYRSTRKLQEEDRQRKTSTRKEGCSFKLRINSTNSGWIIAVQCPIHTGHEPTTSLLAHPILRRFDVASREQVLELVRHGSSTRHIVPLLAQRNPPLLCTSKDIANLIQTYRREVLQGRPPVEALLEWLEEQRWPYRKLVTDVSENIQRLDGLLFAHPRGLELFHRFGTVIAHWCGCDLQYE